MEASLASGALWRQVDPTPGSDQNCPSSAGAVDHYLRTGQVRVASEARRFAFNRRALTATTWAQISAEVGRRPWTYMVVIGQRTAEFCSQTGLAREHYFVVANNGGRVITLDAFGEGHVATPAEYADTERGEGLRTVFVFTGGEFNPTPAGPTLGGDAVDDLGGAL